MSLNSAAVIASLRGLTATFDVAVQSAQPFYPELCTVFNSTGADEQYGFLGAMPGMQEWLGDRDFHKLRAADYTVRNKLWESSVEIERESIEDDRIGLYEMPLASLGEEAAMHPDELVFDLIKDGESNPCFDGQYFYDTDHAWGDSGTQSNLLSPTVADPDAPTEGEFRIAYHAARAAMLGFKNDQGKLYVRPTLMGPQNLLLIVPSNMEEVATKAIYKTLVDGGETNVVLNPPRIVASPYFDSLNSGRSFDLLNLSGRLRPFTFQRRRPLQRQMKGLDDREFKGVKFMTDARYNVGYGLWSMATRSTFASS